MGRCQSQPPKINPMNSADILWDRWKHQNQRGVYNMGHALHHIDTGHPWYSMFEACRAESESFDDVQLRTLITQQLIVIAKHSKPSGSVYYNDLQDHMTMQPRMLAVFDQCARLDGRQSI